MSHFLKLILIHSFLLLNIWAIPAFAGTWTRISPQVLQFEGVIEEDEMKRFEESFDNQVEVLYVNSPGGRTIVGLKIGQKLIGQKIKVIVEGECISACANYLFGAGAERVIKDGMVGFHGNLRAYVNGLKYQEEQKLTFRDGTLAIFWILKMNLGKPKASDSEIMQTFEHYQEMANQEDAFFQSLGISQALFDRSQRPDKGVIGKKYSFLFPTIATFERYGFHGIIGNQNVDMISSDPALVKRAEKGSPPLIE